MVEKVRINPQAFRKGGGRAVPTLAGARLPNLGAVPSVSPVGAQAQVQSLTSLASDFGRLQAVSGDLFNTVSADIQATQSLEAEKVLSDAQVALQKNIEAIRGDPNIGDELIPEKTDEVFKNLRDGILNDDSLSQFQKSFLAGKFVKLQSQVGLNALEFQRQLQTSSQTLSIEEIRQNDEILVRNDPSALQGLLDQATERVNTHGSTLSRIKKREILGEYRDSLVEQSVRGEIDKDPEFALARIQAGNFDKTGLSQDLLTQLENDAALQLKANNTIRSKRRVETQRKEGARLTELVLGEASGAVDESGQAITLSVNDIRDSLRKGSLTASNARALFELKRTLPTNAGNPALAARLLVKISQNKGTGDPVSVADILEAATGDPGEGIPGLNRSEISSLVNTIEQPFEADIENYINNVAKRKFAEISPFGVALFKDDNAAQAFFEFSRELRSKADRLIKQGRDPGGLVIRGTSEFIAEDLLNTYISPLDTGGKPLDLGEGLQEATNPPEGIPPGSTRIFNKTGPNGRDTWRALNGDIFEEDQ